MVQIFELLGVGDRFSLNRATLNRVAEEIIFYQIFAPNREKNADSC